MNIMIWIICGILAYGLAKDYWRQFYASNKYVGYRLAPEVISIMISLSGLPGLLTMVVINLLCGYSFGLCYRMPKELCHPRKELIELAKRYSEVLDF